ncbi:MAG: efflux RND transporter periplasmic adaptor subunit [Alistipes sp.]|nr:efflux RND transporter periplasmic adaptor subunit [Alistipes sp.]
MQRYLAILLLLVGCTPRTTPSSNAPQSVKTAVVETESYEIRDFAALSTADDAVNLAFKISGRIVDLPVAKGQRVRRGEVLAVLDKRDVELQTEAARATFAEAQSRLRRAERLLEHNAISKQEVESLESAVTQARSSYENSLDLLNDTRIVAPFDGVVERVYADTYQRVASGESVVRIVNPVSTTVGFTAPERLLGILELGSTRYEVRFDAWPDVVFGARIKSFARTSSDALGFPVSLKLTDVDTSRYEISPGMTCMARVITPQSDTTAVVVPMTAIYAPVAGGDAVWVVDSLGRVQRRGVEIGRPTSSGNVEIATGLKKGERVVVAGAYKLTDNEQVEIIE